VRAGSVLFEIYADRDGKLASALELAEKVQPFVLSRKVEERMLLDQVPARVEREKAFMLER
jgi:hypothetical protein